MSLPGVTLQLTNGNLGAIGANAENAIIYAGVNTSGTENTLGFYGSPSSMAAALGYGEVLEAASYGLSVSGASVGVMTLPPSVAGALSSVTHTGTGTGAMTVSSAPHATVLVTVTTTGALGTAKATFKVGSGATSQPVTLPTGNTYRVPGTYCVLTFPAHTYTALETYSISTLGVVTYAANGSGGTDGSVTQASSPLDAFRPLLTIGTGGALATAQFAYSLDGTAANTSGAILTTGGGTYALPNTGIYITFSGTLTAGDTYSFDAVGPTYSNADLVTALNLLKTTYLSAVYSLVSVVGLEAAAASDAGSSWSTQCSSLETLGEALFALGIYVRFLNAAPTLGSVTGGASGGTYTINTGATDAALQTTRLSVSAPRVGACAGDEELTSSISGLSFRRNAVFGAAARAVSVVASQNIGAVADGGIAGVTSLYRDETATPGLDAVGFITMRTFPGNVATGGGITGFFITDGHTMDATTSDYYPLTNSRVIDKGCTVARGSALPLVNSKIPTKTTGNFQGSITEARAQQIDAKVGGALNASLVDTDPADAVAASATTDRTHNIIADGNLIINVAIQPYAYARTITIPIGLTTQA